MHEPPGDGGPRHRILARKIAILAGALGLTLLSATAFAQDPVYASPAGGVACPIDRQFAGRASASEHLRDPLVADGAAKEP